MSEQTLTEVAFRELCEAYGGDLARWPVASQAGAARLLGGSDACRAMLEEAAGFDAWLAAALPAPDLARLARLEAQIIHRIEPIGAAMPAPWMLHRRAAAMVCGGMLALGVAAGFFVPPEVSTSLLAAAFGPGANLVQGVNE